MPGLAVVGAQWGDEGKGKIVDLLSRYADVAVRYAGGANAGHTLVVDGRKVVLHLIPSGILHARTVCVIAQGTVVDPEALLEELRALQERGISVDRRLLLSVGAHVVLPHHKLADRLRESGADGIGTTLRGIGPAYEDKTARRGIRAGDLLEPNMMMQDRLERALRAWAPFFASHQTEPPGVEQTVAQLAAYGEELRPYMTDTSLWLSKQLRADKRVLFEGAQGTLLDLDHGTYPFVTSSSATAGGAVTGCGVGPNAIARVLGITKGYATRVGEGPFPTELFGDEGDALRRAGHEFGATTGRPRRCGWLDAVALRYAVRVNGLDELILTKLDVLTGIDPIRVCVGYGDSDIDGFPCAGLSDVTPRYEELPGWKQPIDSCRTIQSLPAAARSYLDRVSQLVGCPVTMASIGAEREAILGLHDPFEQTAGQLA